MLNSFYELTLIVSRIINVDIHLEFQMFDALFNHLNVIEMIVRDNACTSQALVLQACELAVMILTIIYVDDYVNDYSESYHRLLVART